MSFLWFTFDWGILVRRSLPSRDQRSTLFWANRCRRMSRSNEAMSWPTTMSGSILLTLAKSKLRRARSPSVRSIFVTFEVDKLSRRSNGHGSSVGRLKTSSGKISCDQVKFQMITQTSKRATYYKSVVEKVVVELLYPHGTGDEPDRQRPQFPLVGFDYWPQCAKTTTWPSMAEEPYHSVPTRFGSCLSLQPVLKKIFLLK